MVTLAVGNTLRFRVQFYHQGAAYSGAKLRCSVGRKIFGVGPFDEILWAESPALSFPANATARQYEQVVNVPITSDIGPGSDYEAEVKLLAIPGGDIFWHGPLNDIEILGGGVQAVFSKLTVSYGRA